MLVAVICVFIPTQVPKIVFPVILLKRKKKANKSTCFVKKIFFVFTNEWQIISFHFYFSQSKYFLSVFFFLFLFLFSECFLEYSVLRIYFPSCIRIWSENLSCKYAIANKLLGLRLHVLSKIYGFPIYLLPIISLFVHYMKFMYVHEDVCVLNTVKLLYFIYRLVVTGRTSSPTFLQSVHVYLNIFATLLIVILYEKN